MHYPAVLYSYIKKKIDEKVSKPNLEDYIDNAAQHTKMHLGSRPNDIIKNLSVSRQQQNHPTISKKSMNSCYLKRRKK